MAALEPLLAFMVIFVPLAFVGVLVERVARRRGLSRPKAAPAAEARRGVAS
jgi:hypothetical protein